MERASLLAITVICGFIGFGLYAASYAFHGELVLFIADSILDGHALRRLITRMSEPEVLAVSGQIRVRNRVNLLTRLQALEYVIANGLSRMAQGLSGTVVIVPGPIGLFRRSALEQVLARRGSAADRDRPGGVPGPLSGETFCEDFDLSLAVLSLGGRIAYEPAAVSRTEAPDWPFALLSQRYRWVRGQIQVMRKYARRKLLHGEAHPLRLTTWVGVSPFLDAFAPPFVNLAAVVYAVALVATSMSAPVLLGLLAGLLLADLNVALFALSAQDDRLSLAGLLPLLYISSCST